MLSFRRVNNSNTSCEKHLYRGENSPGYNRKYKFYLGFWYTLVTPAVRMWVQEDQEFNVILKLHSKLDGSPSFIKLSLKKWKQKSKSQQQNTDCFRHIALTSILSIWWRSPWGVGTVLCVEDKVLERTYDTGL